jgi:magnesium-transporting ATPase (P-type)
MNVVSDEKRVVAMSSVTRRTNVLLIYMFGIQVLICIAAATYSAVWMNANKGHWYLRLSDSFATELSLRFFTWFIILSQLIPIALIVTSEIVKRLQAEFMNRDLHMYDAATDTPCKVQTTSLNEELGQVQHIL